MNAERFKQIETIYNGLKENSKRVTKNDLIVKSLFVSGGTITQDEADLFFSIKKCPQKYFFNSLYINGVNVHASASIMQGRKKVGSLLRFDTVQGGQNVNDYLVNDKIYINKVGMNYAPEVKTNTCYMFY